MRLIALIAVLTAAILPAAARAQSNCVAFAEAAPGVQVVNLDNIAVPGSRGGLWAAQASEAEVSITYVGHSTFLIETPGGVRIATDFAGYYGAGPAPDIVTMNRAHTSHFTDFPDPAISHVLRGWGTGGAARAEHHLTVGDVLVRNVTTDIRGYGGGRIPDGNSIFIFETAGLCLGHLGHLHHVLNPEHYAQIGRLDVVMAPVDGGYTMSIPELIEVLKTVRASLVLPMHSFGPTSLSRFLAGMSDQFEIRQGDSRTVRVSQASLPRTPVILALQGL